MTTLNDGEDVEQLETWYITLESIYFFLKTFKTYIYPMLQQFQFKLFFEENDNIGFQKDSYSQ